MFVLVVGRWSLGGMLMVILCMSRKSTTVGYDATKRGADGLVEQIAGAQANANPTLTGLT